jgi:hypothetical protein
MRGIVPTLPPCVFLVVSLGTGVRIRRDWKYNNKHPNLRCVFVAVLKTQIHFYSFVLLFAL